MNNNITFKRVHPNYIAEVQTEVKSLLDTKSEFSRDAQGKNTALKAAKDFISKGEPDASQLSAYTTQLVEYHKNVQQEMIDLTVAIARHPKGSSELQTRLNHLNRLLKKEQASRLITCVIW